MIKLEKVSKYYHSNGVSSLGLYNINLEFNKGEIVAITGESGSGKTTLLNVIAKIDSFDSGEIYYNGEATSYYEVEDLDEFRKNKIGFIFQNYQILDSYSVLDNVKLPLLLKGYTNKEATKEAYLLIKKVGLSKRAHSKGSKLSGGEKQRCVIARALASDCDILACDEPTGNLDSKTAKEIIDLILEVAKDKLVLIVTHNLPEVKPYVTRIIKMSDGKIIEDLPNNVYNNSNDFTFENNIDTNQDTNQDNLANTKEKKINNHLIQVAFQNVIYTPLKSTFLLLIFFVISFIYLLMICDIYISYNYSYLSSDFNNLTENYIFAYNEQLSEFTSEEIEKLNKKYDVLYNNFTNESSIIGYFGAEYESIDFLYDQTLDNLTLIKGHMPTDDNEFVIAVNSNDIISDSIDNYLEQNISFYNQYYPYYDEERSDLEELGIVKNEIIQTNFKLVGVCTYDSYNQSSIFITGNDKLLNYLNKFIYQIDLSIGDERVDAYYAFVKDSDKLELIVPETYKDQIFKVELNNTYITDDFIITYDQDAEDIEVRIGLNYEPDEKFFAEIYCNQATIKFTLKKLQRQFKNLSFVIPSKIEAYDSLEEVLDRIFILVGIAIYTLFLALVFLITYFILSRVYTSKAGDYNILRTLGITKKKMARIVNYEILIIGNIAILLTIIVFIALTNFLYFMFQITHIPAYIFIIFIAVMEYFIYSMGRRFNKKLFKFTVATNLKDGGSND